MCLHNLPIERGCYTLKKQIVDLKVMERGFSSYIKACLYHSSNHFFNRIDKENKLIAPFDELSNEVNIHVVNIFFNTTSCIEDYDWLSQAFYLLTPGEQKVIYLKFILERTDQEIADQFGVSRQAISKSKSHILVKLKSYLES